MNVINELFSWTNWDEAGEYGDVILYSPVLKQSIGNYEVGTTFFSAEVLLSSGKLNFYVEDGDDVSMIASFNIKLVVD